MLRVLSGLMHTAKLAAHSALLLFALQAAIVSGQLHAQDGAAPEATPAPADPAGTDTNKATTEVLPDVITADYIESIAGRYPAPEKDKPATSEYKMVGQARDSIAQQSKWSGELTSLEAVIKAASSDTETLTEQAKLEQEQEPLKDFPNTLSEAESMLNKLKLDLDALTTVGQNLQAQISGFTEEKLQVANALNELRARLADLKKQTGGDFPDRLARKAKIQELMVHIQLLERKAASSDQRKAYRTAQRSLNEAKVSRMSQSISLLEDHVDALRSSALREQESKVRDTLRAAAMEHPALKELAQQNQRWIEQRKDLTHKIDVLSEQSSEYEKTTSDIQLRLEQLQQRMAISGYSQSVGELLQRESRRLPDIEDIKDQRYLYSEAIRKAQLTLFDLESARQRNLTYEELLRSTESHISDHADPNAEEVTGKLIQELLNQRKDILEGLLSDTNHYFEQLIATDTEALDAMQAIESFDAFTAENALWIPDQEPISREDLRILPSILRIVLTRTLNLADNVFSDATERLVISILAVLAMAIVAYRVAKPLRPIRKRPLGQSKFTDTLLLLLFECFLGLLPVVFLIGVAWTVNAPSVDNEFADAVAQACLGIIAGTISLVVLYRLTRHDNLGALHFRWSSQSCTVINSTIKRIMLPAYVVAIVANFLYFYGIEFETITGSRVLYISAMCLLLWAFHRVFHPLRGILGADGIRFGLFRHSSLRWSAYVGILLWISLLTMLIALGYMVGVMAMIRSTMQTVWLFAGIAILDGVLTRYIRLNRYQAMLQQKEEEAKQENSDIVDDSKWREIDPQVRHILNLLRIVIFAIGFVFIWRSALPAFRTLGDTALLGTADDPYFKLGQLTMLIICCITTAVLAINLPSVIEIVVFRRIKGITPGNRHAFSTLVAYFIVLLGVIWASFIIQVEWAKVQWLIAAITVGLGFGMQEIFGNLVAGIILLFERPIRVGDIVTIDDTTGVVSRIRIRGTTINEFDRREVIVPNKTIITGKLINWTLSDTLTRLKINVGVNYDSDTDKVTEVLMSILKSMPDVIADPEPRVFFTELADSSLNFICFAYLANMDNRLGTQSAINHAIIKRFREEGINIPYPQRTLHIETDSPIHKLKQSEE